MSGEERSIGFRRSALHLGGLWALAFAQPLFDLLGRNAQFFVARESRTGDILLLALGYVLVPPLAAAGVVWALGRIRPGAGWAAHLVLLALLVAALVLPPLGDALGGSAAAVPVALALGAGGAALYARAAGVRSFATVLSPAPLVVLLLLVLSPVGELVFPGDASGAVSGPERSSTPIVLVVLDELPRSTLSDPAGRIDPALFPAFASLARTSTWYRNATTVDDLTTEAVPSQLTGEVPRRGSLPTADRHPRNLFTLFGDSHDLTVIEPITELCPPRLCPRTSRGTVDRLDGLRADLEVVVQHLLLPEDLREGLPAIDRVWEGFDGGSPVTVPLRGGRSLKGEVLGRLAESDATAAFAQAGEALAQAGPRPPLVFLHSTLPHGAWRFLPDGREYPMHGKDFPGLGTKGWTGPQWLVDQGFQRHVLQVQYTDRLLGTLLDRLRSTGRFDDAVIVVTADHGASFRAGGSRRPIEEGNAPDIAVVPFFVKLPGQRAGAVDDAAVRSVDVLPTIARAAGVRLPWTPAGIPAEERRVDPSAPTEVSHAGVPALSAPLGSILTDLRAREAVEARLLRRGVYAVGPRPELIGRRVAGAPAARGASATVDAPDDYAAIDARAARIPAYVTGEVEGLGAGTELAIAVNGRVAATTRVQGGGGRREFTAIVPPSSLADGRNAIAVLEVRPDGSLRTLP